MDKFCRQCQGKLSLHLIEWSYGYERFPFCSRVCLNLWMGIAKPSVWIAQTENMIAGVFKDRKTAVRWLREERDMDCLFPTLGKPEPIQCQRRKNIFYYWFDHRITMISKHEVLG